MGNATNFPREETSMRKRPVVQSISPSRFDEELTELRLPQRTVCALAEEREAPLSEAQLSSFLSGKRGLSVEMQIVMFVILRFAREEVRRSRTPIDFGNIEPIKKLFHEFCAANDEATVIRTAAEMDREAAEEKKNGATSSGEDAAL
jgi:hypothetical protein